ncbi:MAG TPA: DUF4340 domain-containing protein [Candidatus Obscuribacterales bacterium]
MKLQRTTLILIVLALGLGSFVYFYEIKAEPQRQAAKAKQGKLFSFEKEQIQAFTIKNPEQTLKFERVNQQPGDEKRISPWQMKLPLDVPASDPSVSFLLNWLVDAKSDRTLTVPADDLQEYGLDRPQAKVEVTLKNQETHELILGKPNFNKSFLYAEADPPVNKPQQRELVLVPMDFQYAVNRPLSEWQAKAEKKPDNSDKSVPENSEKSTPAPSP